MKKMELNWCANNTLEILKNRREAEVFFVRDRRILVEIRPRPHSISGILVRLRFHSREKAAF